MNRLKDLLERRVRFWTLRKLVFKGFTGKENLSSARLTKGGEEKEWYRSNLRKVRFDGEDLRGFRIIRCDLSYGEFDSSNMEGGEIRESDMTSFKFNSASLKGLVVSNTNMEGANFKNSSLVQASFYVAGMREMSAERSDFKGSRFILCDLFGSKFKGCDLSESLFSGCDLSYSIFKDVNFKGADLRGCDLSSCEFIDSPLNEARVDGAVLYGVHGFKRAEKLALEAMGARIEKGFLKGEIKKILSSIFHEKDEATIERWSNISSVSLKVLLFGLLLAVIAIVFIKRPYSPTYSSVPPPPPPKKITEVEIEKTKKNLYILRKALQEAYEKSGAYPTMEDIQKNQYDKDGPGGGTEKETLVKGGLPPNLMTDTDGKTIFPYCNDPPTIETIAGDNSDWHYCPETGRVIPCTPTAEINTIDW